MTILNLGKGRFKWQPFYDSIQLWWYYVMHTIYGEILWKGKLPFLDGQTDYMYLTVYRRGFNW